MNPKELRQKMAALVKELGELRDKESLTEDEDSRVDQIIAEMNDLGPKIQRAEATDKLLKDNAVLVQPRQTVAGIVPKEGAEQEQREKQDRDNRSAGQRFIESEQYRRIAETFRRGGRGSAAMDVRTLVQTTTLPSDYVQPRRIPGISRPDDLYGSLRDVLNVGTTDADVLMYFEESSFTNNAAEVAEATEKPESAFTFTQKSSTVATIAHWIPITRQTIWNASEIQSYIEGRLVDGLQLREDSELLKGNGTAPNIRGLVNTSGIQILDNTATTGYWATNPLGSAGTARENFDRINRANTLASTVGRARSNFVVVNPADYEAFQFAADTQGRYYATGPFSGAAIPTLWGRPVVLNENMTEGQALVGDGRQATIWDRMSATVEVGTIDRQFISNEFTLLAEERVGLTVFRPAAFVLVDLA